MHIQPELLAGFLERQSERAKRYRLALRQEGGEIGPNRAEMYARSALEQEFPLLDGPGEKLGHRFVEAVLADGKIFGLAAAVAGLLAVKFENWNAATELAERSIAADQHDTFAQRLLLAATEKSFDLSLSVDEWLRGRFCSNPFEEIEIRANGAVHTCCSAWMPTPIGSIYKDETNDFWNSSRAQEIRRSVLDGDFSHCSRTNCPKIVNRTLPLKEDLTSPLHRHCVSEREFVVDHKPRRILLSEDRSCNLSCPSCRTHLIQLGHRESDQLDRHFDLQILPLLQDAVQIKVTGSGDPFGSRHFRYVLKRLTQTPATTRRIQIQTNGLLCNEKAWKELGLEGHVSSIWVSVDAAKAETYRVVRRLGSFNGLLANLDFLGRLRAEGRIDQFRLDFVVQARNFREMADFVDLAKSVGADGVHFLMIRNWGTFTPEEYRYQNIGSSSHPDYQDFLAMLRDPRLSSPLVDLGNVRIVFDIAHKPEWSGTNISSWWRKFNPFRYFAHRV